MAMNETIETRRMRLRELIRTRYANSQSNFATVTGIKLSQIGQWLASDESQNARNMSERSARRIEQKASLPDGWMDSAVDAGAPVAHAVDMLPPPGYIRLEHLSPRPSMGQGAVVGDEPERIVEYLDVLERWVREKVGSTDPSRVKILTGNGNSMMPTINDKDLVFVDTGCHAIEREGIYVLDVVGRLLLKKALILSDGTLILRSDNTAEYPNEERHDLRRAADTIVVCGKVLAWWTLRRG
ncbi:S24 family peptidase [Castellaniella caeni]|uniref:S24 family peptidase n=1 Tax=Castellaniella caeni TaxID=266123 RepID=UPI000C9FE6CF|nr:S24 family peptidase [Castellaniella caeni]